MNRKLALFVAFILLGLTPYASAQPGVYYAPPSVYAPAPPPPPRGEVILPPPGPREAFVWAPGHYEWSGRSYFWVTGHYIERPEPGLIWEPGRWIDRHGRWEWIGGHWRR
jgi:hypothetical protein